MTRWFASLLLIVALAVVLAAASSPVCVRRAMVLSEERTASQIGADVSRGGGTAVDGGGRDRVCARGHVPSAGNIGGGGFPSIARVGRAGRA
jgi:gamma-glutamyltranspeptidase/glutathione hydrolase